MTKEINQNLCGDVKRHLYLCECCVVLCCTRSRRPVPANSISRQTTAGLQRAHGRTGMKARILLDAEASTLSLEGARRDDDVVVLLNVRGRCLSDRSCLDDAWDLTAAARRSALITAPRGRPLQESLLLESPLQELLLLVALLVMPSAACRTNSSSSSCSTTSSRWSRLTCTGAQA